MADPSDGDELDRPLGLDLDQRRRPALPYRHLFGVGGLALILAVAAGLYIRWDVTGGEPVGKAMLQAEPTPAPTAPIRSA